MCRPATSPDHKANHHMGENSNEKFENNSALCSACFDLRGNPLPDVGSGTGG
jgi:hypothetical protein